MTIKIISSHWSRMRINFRQNPDVLKCISLLSDFPFFVKIDKTAKKDFSYMCILKSGDKNINC